MLAVTSGKLFTERYDFTFQGVQAILNGLPTPSTAADSKEEARSAKTGRPDRVSLPASVSPSDTDNSWFARNNYRTSDKEYETAVERIIQQHNLTPYVTGVSSKLGRRKLALGLIGPDFALTSLEQVVKRLETEKQPERAAAWAMFAGSTDTAIRALKNSKDDRLKLLTPSLASHLSHNRKHQLRTPENTLFKELCASLSSELDDPYLRAIFAYLASNEWQDVLDEAGLPLIDRLGVALRFLDDAEVCE